VENNPVINKWCKVFSVAVWFNSDFVTPCPNPRNWSLTLFLNLKSLSLLLSWSLGSLHWHSVALCRSTFPLGCTGGAVVSALYCRPTSRSCPCQDEIYMENSISAAHPAHWAVMSRRGLYLVEGKAAREWLAIALLMPGLEIEYH